MRGGQGLGAPGLAVLQLLLQGGDLLRKGFHLRLPVPHRPGVPLSLQAQGVRDLVS